MEIWSIFSIIGFIVFNRGKILDFLNNYKIGRTVVFPFVFPYAFYCLIKLAKDEELIMSVLEAKKQKKIPDFFNTH